MQQGFHVARPAPQPLKQFRCRYACEAPVDRTERLLCIGRTRGSHPAPRCCYPSCWVRVVGVFLSGASAKMKLSGLPFPHTAIRQVLRTQPWKSSSGTGSLCCVTNHPNAKQLKTVAVLCSQNLWIGKFGPGIVGLAEALAGEVPTAEIYGIL